MDSTTAVAQGQLKSIVERVERLEDEKKTIADDIKEVYAEAKANGSLCAKKTGPSAKKKKRCSIFISMPWGWFHQDLTPTTRKSLSLCQFKFDPPIARFGLFAIAIINRLKFAKPCCHQSLGRDTFGNQLLDHRNGPRR